MSPQDNRDIEAHDDASSLRAWVHTWRYLFVVIGVISLILLFYAEENWRGDYEWQSFQRMLAKNGESIDPAVFIPRRVADEDNFAMTPALAPLFDFVPGTQHWRNTNAPQLFSSISAKYDAAASLIKSKPTFRVNSWVKSPIELETWAWAFAQGTNRNNREQKPLLATNFSAQDSAEAVLRGLADFGPVLDEIRQASQRPYARFNLRYEEENPAGILLPHLAKIKQLCQVLQLRASAELSLKRTEEAQADLDLIFYLSDTSRAEPIVISQLVRMAELQLALQPLAEGFGKWSEPQLLELQKRLQSFDFMADMKQSLRAERTLFGLGLIEFVRRAPNKLRVMDMLENTGSESESTPLWSVGPLLAVAPNGWLYLEECNYSRLFGDYMLPLMDLTNRVISPDQVQAANAAILKKTQGSPVVKFLHHQLFSSLLLPALPRLSQKVAFGQTAADLATVACALERYRLNRGHLPENLQQLVPQFVGVLPDDIINGKPLAYRPEPDGHYVLYSVGWNQKDDDGTIKQNKNSGLDQNEGDWVWGSAIE